MLKGSTLFMVTVIALIIAILSACLILVAFNYKLYILRNQREQTVELNCTSGINLLLSTYSSLSYSEPKTVDLYGLQNDSVSMEKIKWGIFDIGVVKAFHRDIETKRAFQIGSKRAGVTKSAIYLVDDGNSLAVAGSTTINGTCFLPERGVRATQVSGFNYTGSKFVNGVVKQSSRRLPEISRDPVEGIIELLESDTATIRVEYSSVHQAVADSVSQSFLTRGCIVYQAGPLVIDKTFVGHILIKSESLVIVESQAHLRDVIIVAPDIVISSGFRGNLQAYATDTLVIGENCMLEYPSSLGIIKKEFIENQPSITVGKGTLFCGFIFSYQRVDDIRKTLIRIDTDAKVFGQIYSDGYLELKGNVTGGIMCKKIILNTPSSFYENHLLNVSIDETSLSSDYLMPAMLETSEAKGVMKWLY